MANSRIGLIGGISWDSTAEYYRLLNQLVDKSAGPHTQPEVVIDSQNFEVNVALQRAQDWDACNEIYIDAAKRLESAGATVLGLCANTAHRGFEVVQASVSIPMIDIRVAMAQEVPSLEKVQAEVAHARGSRSLASHLKSRLGLEGIKAAILYEVLSKEQMHDLPTLAATIKALPIRLVAPRPLAEAISSAGGVLFEVLNQQLMLEQLPGVFCAGEMLDWEAPTGGYLLTASMASGMAAGQGAVQYLS